MPARNGIKVVNLRDFTGGLNLMRNIAQLEPNESPDLLNVDISDRGGFKLRKGIVNLGEDLAADPLSLHALLSSSGTQQILACDGTNLKKWDGSSWSTAAARTGTNVGVQFKNKLYLQNGVDASLRWDGAASHAMGVAWNNNLAAPTTVGNGNMPIAKTMTVYKNCVFLGNTYESGTQYPSRIRWSHPGYAEDWVDYHWIDIDTGFDGDEITALVPYQDRLLVFKRNSIHVLYGEGPEAFSVTPVSNEFGTVSQQSAVATDHGVYFYDQANGVFAFDGRGMSWQFSRLYPAITENYITDSVSGEIKMGYGKQRVWLSVPWRGSLTCNRVFVLTPHLNKNGAWTQYDLPLGPFLEYKPAQSEESFLIAGHVGNKRVVKLEQNISTDYYDGTNHHIDAYYRTPWIDMGQPAVRKRWKRPEALLMDGRESEIRVEVYKDFDPSKMTRTFTFNTSASGNDVLVWGVGKWGQKMWGAQDTEHFVLDKGSSLGNGRAVSLKVMSPPNNVPWGVNALVMKVIPRPVRN